MIRELVTAAFLLLGSFFTLVAALGVVRMPDLLTRMHPATKSGTLGVGFVLAAVAVHFDAFDVTTRAVLVVLFIFLTSPVAAHMIGRAAYFSGSETWSRTSPDELRGRYDEGSHRLGSGETGPQ